MGARFAWLRGSPPVNRRATFDYCDCGTGGLAVEVELSTHSAGPQLVTSNDAGSVSILCDMKQDLPFEEVDVAPARRKVNAYAGAGIEFGAGSIFEPEDAPLPDGRRMD